MKVPILIDFIYFFNIKIKANPSHKGNGVAFNLFGDPYGRAVRFAPLGGFATANLSPVLFVYTLFQIIRLNSCARLRLPSPRLGFSSDGSKK